MLAEVGFFSLLIAFILGIYGIGAGVIGGQRHNDDLVVSARNAVIAVFGLLSIATIILVMALVQEEYHLAYVQNVTSPDMPLFYRVTALWGAQTGSLLFWSWLMSLFAAASVWLNWRSYRRLMPYAIGYMMAAVVFFLGLSLFLENPFDRVWVIPVPGTELVQPVHALFQPADAMDMNPAIEAFLADNSNGLNPLLRHWAMAIHPPLLYLGFVGFLVPFAYAMAGLASGDTSSNWIKVSRRWTLVSWLFLSLGLILGGRWAYDVLGWGGYWGWDPVENAAFLPWLTGTAFLHSVMIQEKRGMLKTWNMFLAIGTFSAVIFGTFATRSGLVDSVHSFARSPIGMPMFFFWAGLTIISVSLIMWRRNQGLLKDDHAFVNLMSRETVFVANNLAFILLFAVIFWGTFAAPIVSELVYDTKVTYGPEWFNSITPWLFGFLYLLMGVAPLFAWGKTSIDRLGKSLIVPVLLSLATAVIFYLMGMTNMLALGGYGIIVLAGYVALYETYRGFRARRRIHQENPLQTLATLLRRNPRRYGGYLVHLGVVIIGIGVLGSTVYQAETQQSLSVGESIVFEGYELRYDSMEHVPEDAGRRATIAHVTVLQDGQEVARLEPRRDYYVVSQQSMTIAGVRSSFQDDFYVLLVGWEEFSLSSATFKIYINPFINLVWFGSFVLIFGTMAAMWPTQPFTANARSRDKSKRANKALRGAAS